MSARRALWAAVAMTLCTLPARAGIPSAQQTTLVHYLHALQIQDYVGAYAMLVASDRAYYRDPANFASNFRAVRLQLQSYRITKRTGSTSAARFTVSEHVSLDDSGQAKRRDASIEARYDVAREGNAYRIRDFGHPYKIASPNAVATVNGVRITVHHVAFFLHELAITLTITNLQTGFATVLPYNRSVLTDDRDAVYRSIETKDWAITDKALFLGLRLAGNAQYTGTMRFSVPPGAEPKELHLEIAPVIREQSHAQPFGIAIPAFATVPA